MTDTDHMECPTCDGWGCPRCGGADEGDHLTCFDCVDCNGSGLAATNPRTHE